MGRAKSTLVFEIATDVRDLSLYEAIVDVLMFSMPDSDVWEVGADVLRAYNLARTWIEANILDSYTYNSFSTGFGFLRNKTKYGLKAKLAVKIYLELLRRVGRGSEFTDPVNDEFNIINDPMFDLMFEYLAKRMFSKSAVEYEDYESDIEINEIALVPRASESDGVDMDIFNMIDWHGEEVVYETDV